MENDLLTYLFPGWQKVRDRYNMTGYVFKSDAPLGYSAVMNKTHAVEPVLHVLTPAAQDWQNDPADHRLGANEPANFGHVASGDASASNLDVRYPDPRISGGTGRRFPPSESRGLNRAGRH